MSPYEKKQLRNFALEIAMTAQPSDSKHWFSDLLAAQQAIFERMDTDRSTSDLWSAGPLSLWPWLPMTDAFVDWQQQVMKRFAGWWSASLPSLSSGMPDACSDRRFAADSWKQDPRFDGLARAYLSQSELLRTTLEASPLDARTKAQWSFVLRQVLDALSPANTLLTNPEAIQIALETRGASLGEGARLFVEDFVKGRVSITDDAAFEVGRNVAMTPGSVVFENELIQLIQYAPMTAKVHQRPLLIVPPCINKFYILDLQPENSLVAYAVSQGHTLFLVSWRNVFPAIGPAPGSYVKDRAPA